MSDNTECEAKCAMHCLSDTMCEGFFINGSMCGKILSIHLSMPSGMMTDIYVGEFTVLMCKHKKVIP